MKLDLSPPLEETRRMLEGSLRLKPSEPIPAVPRGLLDDLSQRYASRKIIIEPKLRPAWIERLRSIAASPAFGLAAAAVMVFSVVTPLVNRGSDAGNREVFRGINGEVSAPAMVVLINPPASLEHTLAHSGQFEADSFVTVQNLEAAETIGAPKVILDFESASIRGVNDNGEVIHTGSLPSSIADLTLSIADALNRL